MAKTMVDLLLGKIRMEIPVLKHINFLNYN